MDDKDQAAWNDGRGCLRNQALGVVAVQDVE
jgi:hypothetical protein